MGHASSPKKTLPPFLKPRSDQVGTTSNFGWTSKQTNGVREYYSVAES
jgi:hypothetical protein